MKRFFSIVIAVIALSAGVVYADNTARIKEISDEIQKLLNTKQQYVSALDQINVELLRKDGAIAELKKQDKEVKESNEIPAEPAEK